MRETNKGSFWRRERQSELAGAETNSPPEEEEKDECGRIRTNWEIDPYELRSSWTNFKFQRRF